MGIVNHFRGYDSRKEIYCFNGVIKDNIDLPWEHVKIYKGSKEIDPDYEVQENDVILIDEFHGAITTAAIILGAVSLAIGIGAGIYAHIQIKEAEKEMKAALDRIGKDNKQKEIASIPQMGDARNERAEGKNAPIILGRHQFAPYFLSEPYMRPSGQDGTDLYWYGSFLCGQEDLWFEKIRNGTIDLAAIPENDNKAQSGFFPFDDPGGDTPPFYDPANFIEIAQDGYDFTETRFNEKWVDSLESSVELGRKRNAAGEDDGDEPVIRETARYPMRAEIELFLDGLHGWDSKNNRAVNATVEIDLEWSRNGVDSWESIPIQGFNNTVFTPSKIFAPHETIEYVYRQFTSASAWNRTINIPMPVGGMFGNTRVTSAIIKTPNIWGFTQWTITLRKAGGGTIERTGSGSSGVTLGQIFEIFSENMSSNSNTLTRNKMQQMRFIAAVNFPHDVYSSGGDPVFIRATRKTKMRTGGYRDRVTLSAIRTQQYNPKTSSDKLVAATNINERLVDKFCRMGIKIKVNLNTKEILDRFNIIASMTGRTWNNGWSPNKTKTSNPAAVLLELITGLIHAPSRHRDNEIDLKSFGELYDYCQNTGKFAPSPENPKGDPREVLIEGITQPVKFNLECNGVLTSGTRKIDAIKSVLATCDGGLYIDELGKIQVYYDHKQEIPIALLNPQRIISMVDQRSLARKADGYDVEYIDQEAEWNQTKHKILRPRLPEKEPGTYTYSSLRLDFTTSYNQAMWHTRRIMAKEIQRPGEVKAAVGKEGRFYKPGSLIKVQHERFKIGLGSGEVVELIRDGDDVVGLRLMERFDIAKDRDYWAEYYVVDSGRNKVVTKRIDTSKYEGNGEYTNIIYFTTPIAGSDIPVYQNILSAMYGETKSPDGVETPPLAIYQAKRYIVADLSENHNGYDLTLVPYSDEVYETTSIHDIPAYQSTILTSPPRIYDGIGKKPIDGEPGQGLVTPADLPELVEPLIEEIAETAVSERSPRYRGRFFQAGRPDGTISTITMNRGDWVSYMGNGETDESGLAWRKHYVYRWTGTAWAEVDETRDTAPYMAALADITEGAPREVFSSVIAGHLTALKIVAEKIGAHNVIINENGSIESRDFISINDPLGRLPKGFRLRHDGDAEFNDGHFRGELQARYIRITGSISSGTQFILRSNNSLAALYGQNAGWVSATYMAVLKEIRTLARGSCLLRLRFPTVGNTNVTNINMGTYRIMVNDTVIRDWTNYTVDINIDISNVSLPNNVNTISLYGRPAINQLFVPSFFNSIFELRCAQDPGFLAVLG
jgi:hypothetical protein